MKALAARSSPRSLGMHPTGHAARRSDVAQLTLLAPVLALALATVSCASERAQAPGLHRHADGTVHDDHGYDGRGPTGVLLVTRDGGYDALLSAHLSAEGNELDIYLQKSGGDGQPAALPDRAFGARIVGRDVQVRFECAPAEERPPTEPEGQCSHFVARTPWMRSDETLDLRTEVAVNDASLTFAWQGFRPDRYAHAHAHD
jgi:hypothetical protein